MFKAKLIENENYYKLRSKQLSLMILTSIPIGLLANFYQMPVWATILIIGIYIAVYLLTAKNQKQINSMVGNRSIEIDQDEIRIKSKKGIEEVFKLNAVDKIILKDEYSIPQETLKEVGQEMTGKTKQNFVIVQQAEELRKLDFEIDSYYMVKQLDKLIESWKLKEYKIERVNNNLE